MQRVPDNGSPQRPIIFGKTEYIQILAPVFHEVLVMVKLNPA